MSIIVGVDSYVTVEQATEYIDAYYVSDSEQREAWDAMADSDREIYLRRAAQGLGRVPYRGVKCSADQALSFPRCFDVNACFGGNGDIICRDASHEVPISVKHAQVEEALELMSPTADSEAREIRNGSVESFSIGHFSESYNLAAADSLKTAIASSVAQGLIAPYVRGGYEIR